MEVKNSLIRETLLAALREDVGEGDITTDILIGPDKSSQKAKIVARSKGVLAGVDIAKEIFLLLDAETKFAKHLEDGDTFEPEDTLLELETSPCAILKGERVALNFLQRLSGIATITRRFVNLVSPYGVKILDTRKTTPTLRLFEKYAVRVGGGFNHRFNLSSGILIKDNHIKLAGGIKKAVKLAKENAPPFCKIEVEITTMDELKEAIDQQIDVLMLDNFNQEELKRVINLVREKSPKTLIEVSGGIKLGNVEDIAKLRPDFISVGGITHSVSSVDMSLEIL